MNIETRRYSLESCPASTGYTLREKQGRRVAFLCGVPSPQYLAMITESRFDKEAAAAMESGQWN